MFYELCNRNILFPPTYIFNQEYFFVSSFLSTAKMEIQGSEVELFNIVRREVVLLK